MRPLIKCGTYGVVSLMVKMFGIFLLFIPVGVYAGGGIVGNETDSQKVISEERFILINGIETAHGFHLSVLNAQYKICKKIRL